MLQFNIFCLSLERQVALLAVSAVTAGLGHVLEEQPFVRRPDHEKRLVLEGPLADSVQGADGGSGKRFDWAYWFAV